MCIRFAAARFTQMAVYIRQNTPGCIITYMLLSMFCALFVVDDVDTMPPKKTDQLKVELSQYLNVCFSCIV